VPRLIDISGQRFGYWTVVGYVGPTARTRAHEWRCICVCGVERVMRSHPLRVGLSQSCGCRKGEYSIKTRGLKLISKMPEYPIWQGMRNRCFNPNVESYPLYGGRGITVCDRWCIGDGEQTGFECFFADIGPRPSKVHSLDRVDPDGNYQPGNVRWASNLEQANNRRKTRTVTYLGREMALTDAVRAAGSVIHHEAAWIRIRTGWTVERSVETPRIHESGNSNARRAREHAAAETKEAAFTTPTEQARAFGG
jgi:hypothetical protein